MKLEREKLGLMKEINAYIYGKKIGYKMKVLIEVQKIVLEPIKQLREKYDINNIVKNIPNNYKTYEEFDKKVGLEEW